MTPKNLRWKLFVLWLKEHGEDALNGFFLLMFMIAIYYGKHCLSAKRFLFGPAILNILFFALTFGYIIYIILYVICYLLAKKR